MSFKDVLVYAEAGGSAKLSLGVACRLAAEHSANLAALHVKSPPVVMADMGGFVPPEMIAWQEKSAAEAAVRAKEITIATARSHGIAPEWREADGDPFSLAVLHAHYSDLVVVGQDSLDDEANTSLDGLAESMIMGSGRPVLVVPRVGNFASVGRQVLIAWNRTREATRAVHDAMPILRRADKATIMEVRNPHHNDGDRIHGVDIAAHLARHGVKVEVSSTSALSDIDVSQAILSRAADLGADLLVMGAYGHWRLREFVFGGVTREILDSMTIPVFMSH